MTNKKQIILSIILFIIVIICFIQTINIALKSNTSNKVLSSKSNNLDLLKEELRSTKDELNKTYNKTLIIQHENKTILHDPTYEEAHNFVLEDKTDENTYDYKNYNCDHFSRDFNNNADRRGIRCAFVVLEMEGNYPSHAIVAFKTTDEGMVYFEPQTDERVLPKIGSDYWKECIISEDTSSYPTGYILKEVILYW